MTSPKAAQVPRPAGLRRVRANLFLAVTLTITLLAWRSWAGHGGLFKGEKRTGPGSLEAALTLKLVDHLHAELARQDEQIAAMSDGEAFDQEGSKQLEEELGEREAALLLLRRELEEYKATAVKLGSGPFFITGEVQAAGVSRTLLFPRNDIFFAGAMMKGEGWEVESLETSMNLLQLGDVAVDVGANCGLFAAMWAARVGPAGLIVAFEPQRLLYQAATATMVLNGITNVKMERAIAAHIDGAAQLSAKVPVKSAGAPDRDMEQAIRDNSEVNYVGLTVGVGGEAAPMYSLDTYLAEVEANVTMIKVDVEGPEDLVWWGARRTIEKHRPALLTKADHVLSDETIAGLGGVPQEVLAFRLAEFLEGLNYTTLPGVSMWNKGYIPIEKLVKNSPQPTLAKANDNDALEAIAEPGKGT